MAYISPVGLRGLDEYKYKAGAYSWLDLQLNPFWFACAERLPKWVAPNLVTLVGTTFLASIGVGVFVYDPLLKGEAPSWVYLWFAFCVWVYQTLDAVDGKQARRTGSSSPLGQLFDHGCDALGTTPLALAFCSALGLGPTFQSVLLLATIQLPFLSAQFEEHYAHSMRTQVANFGVTEGQYLEVVLMLVTAVFGSEFWNQEIPATGFLADLPGNPESAEGLTLRAGCIYSGSFFPALLFLAAVRAVWSTPAAPGAYFKLLPIFALEFALSWVSLTPTTSSAGKLFSEQPVLFLTTFGFVFSHLTNQIIIASVCKIPFPSVQLSLMLPVPFLILLNPPIQAFVGYSLLAAGQYFHYVILVSNQLADHLNIHVFKLGAKRELKSAGPAKS